MACLNLKQQRQQQQQQQQQQQHHHPPFSFTSIIFLGLKYFLHQNPPGSEAKKIIDEYLILVIDNKNTFLLNIALHIFLVKICLIS